MWRTSFAFSDSLSVKSALRHSGGTARTELDKRSTANDVSIGGPPGSGDDIGTRRRPHADAIALTTQTPGQARIAISATRCRSLRVAPLAACTDMPLITVATYRASAAGFAFFGRSPSFTARW